MSAIPNEAFDDGKFAGIRDESFFFSPLASNSEIMISTKHLFYIIMMIAIPIMIGFERLHPVLGILIPFFLVMIIYRPRGIQMEYVIYYFLLFFVSYKKEKSNDKKTNQQDTAPLFASTSFGRLEKNKTDLKTQSQKKIRTQKIENPDDPIDLELNVGIANRLRYVDVIIGERPIARHVPVESDGKLLVSYTPGKDTGIVSVKVIPTEGGGWEGTTNTTPIASEDIILEIIPL